MKQFGISKNIFYINGMSIPFKFFKGKVYTDEYTVHNRVEQNHRNVNFNPPIDERYPEYYNTDEYVFFDVTQVIEDPIWSEPYKFMLFRHIEGGDTVQGQRIGPDHPMWNFPDVI
jgi:hypothetical protein